MYIFLYSIVFYVLLLFQHRKTETSTSFLSNIASKSQNGTLVKSGSFSGRSCIQLGNERHTVSDPSNMPFGVYGVDTSTTSGADSDDDRRNKRLPQFKIGEKTSYLTTTIRGASPGKLSIKAEEQSSSLSEQAWDSYQEKYLSEAYSETHDSDAARRLLEFGEDYRNFLDSQSDWSNQSNTFSPRFPRKFLQPINAVDSDNDSDCEEMKKLLKLCHEKLKYNEEVYYEHFNIGLKEYRPPLDIVSNKSLFLEFPAVDFNRNTVIYCRNLKLYL